ncbi:MAG TPA: hypothetical protein VMP03_06660, partial [Methylomirabilota bacterium]|nr:hypothetical protein [Methylomirabilota bacterium]
MVKSAVTSLLGLLLSASISSGAAAAIQLQIPMTRTVEGQTVSAEFKLTAGDADFFGHGPDVSLTVKLRVSPDGRNILADLNGTANEVGGTTRARLNVTGAVVYTIEAGNAITSLVDPVTTSVLSYRDSDHAPDFVCPGAGELPKKDATVIMRNHWGLACTPGPVQLAVFTGDTNGSDVNTGIANSKTTRTSVQVLFSPLKFRVQKAVSSPSYLEKPVQIGVPFGSYPQENFVDNGCSASVGFRMLQFYGKSIDYPTFYKQIRSRFHTTNIFNLGVPPGMLRDALNAVQPGYSVVRWNYAADSEDQKRNAVIRADMKARMVNLLRQGKPMIALLGWGSKTAIQALHANGYERTYGLYSPELDDVGLSRLHYVVVRGYSPLT